MEVDVFAVNLHLEIVQLSIEALVCRIETQRVAHVSVRTKRNERHVAYSHGAHPILARIS